MPGYVELHCHSSHSFLDGASDVEELVTAAFTLILGAIALAVGLAFGLGNRELAGEITRRWYEESRSRPEGAKRRGRADESTKDEEEGN